MIAAVINTHSLNWYLAADPRLSNSALAFIETAAGEGSEIGVSAITLVEIVYLVEKGKIPAQHFTQIAVALLDETSFLREIPVDIMVSRALSRVSAAQVPDMPDRIIAATAISRNVPAISRDRKIQLSNVATIW